MLRPVAADLAIVRLHVDAHDDRERPSARAVQQAARGGNRKRLEHGPPEAFEEPDQSCATLALAAEHPHGYARCDESGAVPSVRPLCEAGEQVRLRTPKLDFVVIGAQKAGTTSLWRYLEDNPALAMPPAKEASFFCEPAYPSELRPYMRALFKDAPLRATLGKVTPTYMLGVPGVAVGEIAERIHRTFPAVRIVALLRDPVARARSAHRMATRDSGETRSFEQAVADLLEPAELERARAGPEANSSYVVGGEYGRVLEPYVELFGRERVHVELTSDLERAPGEVVHRVCEHIGVTPHSPARLSERFYRGGPRRLTAEAEADLKGYLDRHVWPRVRYSAQHREAFEFWFGLWNVEPEPAPEPPDEASAERLRAHYAADARRLEAATGLRPPWAD